MSQEQQPEVSEASDTDDVIELTAKDIRPWDGARPLKERGDIRLKSGASSPAEKDDKKPVETLAPIKKPATQKQLESMKRAQAARQEQLRVKRQEEEEAKHLIEKSYHAELEAQLIKTEIPKYSKQIKKQILEKLRKQKLEELKKQYGYKSDVSESDSDSSDEEVVVVRKKAPKKQAKIKQEPMIVPKKGLLQTYKDFGF